MLVEGPWQKLKQDCKYLSDLSNISVSLTDVKVILGQDAYDLIRPLEYKSSVRSQPWAVKTALGWTISEAVKKRNQYRFLATLRLQLTHWRIRWKNGGTWRQMSPCVHPQKPGSQKGLQRSLKVQGNFIEWWTVFWIWLIAEFSWNFFSIREHQIAITADIESIYVLQVAVRKEECRVLRFSGVTSQMIALENLSTIGSCLEQRVFQRLPIMVSNKRAEIT